MRSLGVGVEDATSVQNAVTLSWSIINLEAWEGTRHGLVRADPPSHCICSAMVLHLGFLGSKICIIVPMLMIHARALWKGP